MTEQTGAESPPGPGWWMANDGRWYPPASVPAPPVAPRRTRSPWWPPSGWNLAAVIVLVLGMVVATAGIAFGGSDEDPDALRADITDQEQAVEAAQQDLDAAEASEASMQAFVTEYAATADDLSNLIDEACDCGEELTGLRQQQLEVLQGFFQNPSDAALDAVDSLSRDQNAQLQLLWSLLDDARSMSADLPEPPAG